MDCLANLFICYASHFSTVFCASRCRGSFSEFEFRHLGGAMDRLGHDTRRRLENIGTLQMRIHDGLAF